jgi:hypothetical protein
MRQSLRRSIGIVLALGALSSAPVARADFEVTGPDGRRIVLKDDGTWRYVDAAVGQAAKDGDGKKEEAVLSLLSRREAGPNCHFRLRLVNNLPYEIHNIVPTFVAYRANGVVYDSRTTGFYSMKPGNNQERELRFQGITCAEIDRLQVTGGDRCGMGELTRFSPQVGECLSRVRVVKSELLRFEK